MAKNFPLRKMKTNRSKREVMISCTHFETHVGWEPGPAPRSPALVCVCHTRGRHGFLSVANVCVCLSTASRDWASPRKEASEARCVGQLHWWAWELAPGRKNLRSEGFKSTHPETQVTSLMGKRGTWRTQKLSHQWKRLLPTVGWYGKI